MPSGPTSVRPRHATPSPSSIGSGPTPSPSTHTRAERRSSRSSSGPIATPTSCAGRRTPRRPRSRTWSSRGCVDRRAGRGSPPARRAPRGDLGPRRNGRPGGRGDGAHGAARDPRRGAGLGFLVPGIGAQGGEIEPVLRDGPATATPAAGGAGRGLLVNVSRGHQRRRAGRGEARSADRPGRAARGGRPRLGFAPPCANVTRARGPHAVPDPAYRSDP
jgi:hypothetical protein